NEVRYVLVKGRLRQGSTSLEVTAADVTIDAPDVVRAKHPVKMTWTQPVNGRDLVTIVPAGAEDDKIGDYLRVSDHTDGKLTAPDAPGLYEVRYMLNKGRATLASTSLEVVDEEAALDSGGIGLQVPETVSAGDTITATWSGSGDGDDQRVTLAQVGQSDFTWIEAHKVDDDKQQQFTLPDEAAD